MTRHADEVKLRTTEVKKRRPFLADEWMAAAEDDIRDLLAQHEDLRRRNALLRTRTDVDADEIAKRVGYEMNLTEALSAHAALAAKCERLEGLLREIEWGGSDHISGSDDDKPACPYCGSISPQEWTRDFAPSRNGHRDYCKLAAALAPQPEGDKT